MTQTTRAHCVSRWTLHECETVPATRETLVRHVVLPPRRPARTPLADLRDAGYRVVSYGVFPEDIPDCPAATGYPGCEHVLVDSTADPP